MIIGVGVDIVDVDRVRRAVERHGERFLRRVYSSEEVKYCRESRHSDQRFATRFAAKEAVLKALGIGWQGGTSFTDIEVSRDARGAPSVTLYGQSRKISRDLGVCRIHISLSHTETHAMAYAVAEGSGRAF